jgi:hypothetical protein
MTKIKHPTSKRDRLKIAEKKRLDAEKKERSRGVRKAVLREIREEETNNELRTYDHPVGV